MVTFDIQMYPHLSPRLDALIVDWKCPCLKYQMEAVRTRLVLHYCCPSLAPRRKHLIGK